MRCNEYEVLGLVEEVRDCEFLGTLHKRRIGSRIEFVEGHDPLPLQLRAMAVILRVPRAKPHAAACSPCASPDADALRAAVQSSQGSFSSV